MPSTKSYLASACVVAGLFAGGCHNSSPESSGPLQSSMTTPDTNSQALSPSTMPAPSAHQTEVTIPAGKPPAAKDLTHELTKDEPFFLDMPSGDAKPVGTLKAGDKVLVMVPGAEYSQVTTSTGVSAYVPTDGLKPLGK